MPNSNIKQHFQGHRPVLLIVMDGWGMGSGGPEDAIALARTPNFDRLWANYPHTQLLTHGRHVGLSNENDLGGSEVGHMTMGAGKILDQGPTRINKAIADGSFFHSPDLAIVLEPALKGGTLHLLGLLSDGNVHSHIDHFIAIIRYADHKGVQRLRVHAIFDGRDVGIQTADQYVRQLQILFDEVNNKPERSYCFASGGGREVITMDRDRQWSKVKYGWNVHVHGKAENRFTSMEEAIRHFRERNPDLVDQDMPGFVIVDDIGEPVGRILDGDAVIMMNFRADRALEITEAFCLDDFCGFERGKRPHVVFAGMMVYDGDRHLPNLQIVGPAEVERPFGQRILERGIKQFRLAETQKYAHVTFFFNGGYREPLDVDMEDYILIPSDKGISFDQAPAMKAAEIATKAARLVISGEYGFGLINFANADMVGHCGKLEPAIRAVEAVDAAVGRICSTLEEAGGSALVTADHGNAEEMRVKTRTGDEPSTRHSINPVPCILFDPGFDGSYALRPFRGVGLPPEETPGLSNVAATLFQMLGEEVPEDLNPSLIRPAGS